MPCPRDPGEQIMRIDVIGRSVTGVLCSGVLVAFLFAAGCSDKSTSGNKLDDPQLKAYMQETTDQFKAKMQERKTNNPNKGRSKGSAHP
jgi:hypothetical protein